MSTKNDVTMSKSDVLHAAAHIIQMELMLNRSIDKFLDKLGLTREEVGNHGSVPSKVNT